MTISKIEYIYSEIQDRKNEIMAMDTDKTATDRNELKLFNTRYAELKQLIILYWKEV